MQNGNSSIDLRWHVLLCDPMRELVASKRLRRMGLDCYVPTITRTTTGRSRNGATRKPREVVRSMFPGYLFLALNSAWSFGELYRVPGLRTGEQRTTSPFLRINGAPATISDDSIELIRNVEAAIADPTNPIGAPFKVGDAVQMTTGPFEGKLMRVVEMSDSKRIELLMDMLGRKVRVFAAAGQIEPEAVFVRP